jgi:hypothetical protein
MGLHIHRHDRSPSPIASSQRVASAAARRFIDQTVSKKPGTMNGADGTACLPERMWSRTDHCREHQRKRSARSRHWSECCVGAGQAAAVEGQ